MADIIITKPTPTDVEVLQAKNDESLPQQVVEGGNEGEIDYIAVKQVLEIDRDSTEYDKDISTLVEWAKLQTGNSDPMEMKWAIRDLRMRLGTPTYGDAIKHLARFAYLDLEEKRIKKAKTEFV